MGKRAEISTLMWRENNNGENFGALHISIHIHEKGNNTAAKERIGHSFDLLPHFHRYYYY
ncbi:MAG: hypothetical protein MUO50_10060 [Longimicrobiales bacterium]|nr:hypothetical protein [Longimicrobiales bacterium]